MLVETTNKTVKSKPEINRRFYARTKRGEGRLSRVSVFSTMVLNFATTNWTKLTCRQERSYIRVIYLAVHVADEKKIHFDEETCTNEHIRCYEVGMPSFRVTP